MQTAIEKVDLTKQISEVRSLADLKEYPRVLDYIFKSVMEKEVDYGDPFYGAPKPSLWKPGAELLATVFHLVAADPLFETKVEDWNKPFFAYTIKQRFYDERSDVLRGTGIGSANTGETRYCFRKIWGKDYEQMKEEEKMNLIQRRTKDGLEWFRPSSADEILTQSNTVLKISSKRSYVDGILKITGADRIFTQDLEDYDSIDSPVEHAKSVNPPKENGSKPVEKGVPIKSGLEGRLS